MKEEKIFKLKGKTLAIVDWANVYGWFEKLKWEIDPKKLYDYLKLYPEIYDIRFYFGIEKGNIKSENIHRDIKEIGYTLISKEVKWIPVSLEVSHFRNHNGKIKPLEFIGKDIKERTEVNNILKGLRNLFSKKYFYRRKCDFDVEITKDVLLNMENFESLILFSGDGDFKTLVEYLLEKRKQVIVVHPFGMRGREYNELLVRKGNRPYFCAVEKLTPFLKKNLPE